MISFMKKTMMMLAAVVANAAMAFVGVGDSISFTNVNEIGSFQIEDGKYAKARIVAIGGGGAGGTVGQDIVQGAAGGGGAGGLVCRTNILESGTYYVSIGRGGRKAEMYSTSWVGDDGEYSYIGFGSETNYIVSVKGGGGGGSVKNGGQGTPGASGGGGSWYGKFLAGGLGTDGYGWNGGTPTNISYGAGGGGSGSTGKADGAPGAGTFITIDSTGMLLANGGHGGRRGDDGYAALDGANFGDGGDGAVNGFGGSGHDGAVFVEILKVFEYKTVEIPDYAKTFSWTNGNEYAAYDFSAVEGIESVVGTTNVVCSLDGTNMVGVGRYKFTAYLKEEYRWSDGTIDPKTFSWRVNEPNVVGNMSVEVTKTVDWSEGTNAVISITIHSTPEKKKTIPNVLFIGSLCGAHGFTSDILNAALNAITKVGNVDYYFFNRTFNLNSASGSTYNETDSAYFSGSLNKGETHAGTIYALNPNDSNSRVALESTSGNHGTMNGFYRQIYTSITNGTSSKYDYIIFSFDRSRLAERFEKIFDHEAEVAKYLESFYKNSSVIWLVDEQADDKEPANSSLPQTPWYPSQLTQYNGTYWETLDAGVSYWKGSSTTMNSWVSEGSYAYAQYNALVGLMCPSNYPVNKTTYVANVLPDQSGSVAWTADSMQKIKNTACAGIENQVVYNNASNVAEVIENVIKPTVATLDVQDNIYVKNGLKFDSSLTKGYWTTNSSYSSDSEDVAISRWTEYKDNELVFSDEEGLKISLPGVQSELWSILKIGVIDTGKFLSSVDAKYNEKTGKWEKDPNNGPVEVEMKSTSDSILAEDSATTTVSWSFEAFKITGENIHGDGEFVINGFYTNIISVAKGYNPEVLFKAAPGWALDYLEVDGQAIEDYEYMTNWFFNSIEADHDVKVGFTNIVVNPPPPEIGPTTNVYDGTGYTVETLKAPTFAEGYEEYSNMWYIVYSLDPDASPTNRSAWTSENLVTNSGTTTVYARICLMQPGYEDGAIVPYWLGTNTVTILPREITIQYDDYVQTSTTRNSDTFKYNLVDSEIVEGDYFTVESGAKGSGLCTNFPDKGSKTVDSIGISSGLTVKTPGFDGCNYIINVIPADYYYPNLNLVATAENITKYYDGKNTNINVIVTYPINAKTINTTNDWVESKSSSWYQFINYNNVRTRVITNLVLNIEYSLDSGNIYSSQIPSYVNVGKYEIMYKVTYSGTETTETQTKKSKNSQWSSSSFSTPKDIEYTPYIGSATIEILPHEVVITAGTKSKTYDGNPLVDPSYTVEGFISNEGIDSAKMTSGSTITSIGSVANVVDLNSLAYKSNTLASNYIIKYVDGKLTIVDIPGGGGSEGYIDEIIKPWITDHDNSDPGFVYLAFDPRYMTTNDIPFDIWLERTSANSGFKMKYGRTREECDSCDPVAVEVSEVGKHVYEMSFKKVWVKVPVSNIVNIASVTTELAKPTGYIRLFVAAVANSQDPLAAEGVDSSNVFGILKIESSTTNTMVAIPWTWYSEAEEDAESIPAKKLVKTENLSEDDMLYDWADTNKNYRSWIVESSEFSPIQTVMVDAIGNSTVNAFDEEDANSYSNSTRVARGNGMWLTRKIPVNGETVVPFWVYGQSVLTPVTTEVLPPSGTNKVCSTMLGNPFAKEVRINDLVFEGSIASNDRIWVPNGTTTPKYLIYTSKGWRYTYTSVVDGKRKTILDYDVKVPAGQAFWYDRRGNTSLRITWK